MTLSGTPRWCHWAESQHGRSHASGRARGAVQGGTGDRCPLHWSPASIAHRLSRRLVHPRSLVSTDSGSVERSDGRGSEGRGGKIQRVQPRTAYPHAPRPPAMSAASAPQHSKWQSSGAGLAPPAGWTAHNAEGWSSTGLPLATASTGFPVHGQHGLPYGWTNASTGLPSSESSRPPQPGDRHAPFGGGEALYESSGQGAGHASLGPLTAGQFLGSASWAASPSTALALQRARWAQGQAFAHVQHAYSHPAAGAYPPPGPWYTASAYAGGVPQWARLAQGGWPPAAMVPGGYNSGLAYPGDDSPGQLTHGFRWRLAPGMVPMLGMAGATPSPLPRASPSRPQAKTGQVVAGGHLSKDKEEDIPVWAHRSMSEAPRPPWAVGEHRCTTCKGRPLSEDPWMYFSVDKGRWNHSCVICLLKRRSRSKKPPSFSSLEVTLLQRARRTAASQVQSSSTVALVRSGTRAICTIDAMLSPEGQSPKMAPQPVTAVQRELPGGGALGAPPGSTTTANYLAPEAALDGTQVRT